MAIPTIRQIRTALLASAATLFATAPTLANAPGSCGGFFDDPQLYRMCVAGQMDDMMNQLHWLPQDRAAAAEDEDDDDAGRPPRIYFARSPRLVPCSPIISLAQGEEGKIIGYTPGCRR